MTWKVSQCLRVARSPRTYMFLPCLTNGARNAMTKSAATERSALPAHGCVRRLLYAGILITLLRAPIALAQSSLSVAVPGLSGVDSMINAEFAKDSIGSITVGVI